MGILDDILQGAQGAATATGNLATELVYGTPASQRIGEINKFARAQGFRQGVRDPRFAEAHPDLAEEAQRLASEAGTPITPASPERNDPVSQGAATAEDALGLPPGSLAQAAGDTPFMGAVNMAPAGGLAAARGARPSGGGTPPPQAGVPHPQGPAGGWVPNQAANPPGAASPQGPIGPMPGRVNGGIPMPGAAPAAPAAAQAGTGLLGTIGNAVRQHPIIATALAGGGLLATGAAARGRSSAPPPADPNAFGPGMPITENAWQQADKAEEKRQAEARRATQARRDNADIGLTEAQAAYYQAQREKALKELANDDLTESEKQELAHEYAMAEVEARARHERETTMIREAGENERNERRIGSEEKQTAYRGGVEMRGQDQQARQAQDAFVTNWLQNQIANGQLSLDRATKMFEAYQKQQTLPAEILDKVSQSVERLAPYMTNRSNGEQPDYVKKYGQSKHYKVNSPGTSDFDPFQMAREYGAVPPSQPMPTVDQVFQGAGQGADMSPEAVEGIRGASASSTQLPRPEMPDDVQQRIMAGLR